MSATHVDDIKYEIEKEELTIRYGGGSTYIYSPVTKQDYIDIFKETSFSKGVHKIIRRGKVVGVRQ